MEEGRKGARKEGRKEKRKENGKEGGEREGETGREKNKLMFEIYLAKHYKTNLWYRSICFIGDRYYYGLLPAMILGEKAKF